MNINTIYNFRRLSIALLFAFLALPAVVEATHIVGGKMGYRCLGNNQYEITLEVYRDCINGIPNFDDPAFVGVYRNNFVGPPISLAIPYVVDDTLTSFIIDPCLVVQEEVCVDLSVYRAVVTLPFSPGGYTIAYQRCCRNETINNIVAPVETGATFSIVLTEAALTRCNTSPDFVLFPPIYICADFPLSFDHSATDLEGDSLVYRLCTPLSGGSLTDGAPQPPNTSPPYDEVVWNAPLYSLENVLGLGTPLTINPSTGLMTAVPGIQGQFVVGVCVEEYDRATGQLLSMTRRDFQYNVVLCEGKVAAFAVPNAQCDDLDVPIQNLSENATTFEWYFDFPFNTMTSTTTDLNFVHTYPDTGTYTIMLIAEPNSVCADTFFRTIFLQSNSLEADFILGVFDCQVTSLLELVDLSSDPVSPPVAWQWVISYNGITQESSEQNPFITVPQGVTGTVSLTVTSQNGCVRTVTKPFVSGQNNPGVFIDDLGILQVCEGESIALNPNTPPDITFTYNWSPSANLDNSTAINPIASITESTTFSVTITPSNNICEIVRTVTVLVAPKPALDFTTELGCDGLTVNFTNTSQNAAAFNWDFGVEDTDTDVSSDVNPSFTFPGLGTYTVTLSVANSVCVDTITREVTISQVELGADFTASYLDCSQDSVVVQFTDQSFNTQNNTNSWSWAIGGVVFSTEQNPTYTFFGSQTAEVSLTIGTTNNCETSRTRNITVTMVEDQDQFPDTLIVCIGGSAQAGTGGDAQYSYLWSPATGLDDPTAANPVFSPTETTLYTVSVSGVGIDTCQFVEEMLVFVTPAINLSITGDGTTCEPNAVLTAAASVPVTVGWYDVIDNLVFTGDTFTFPISGSIDLYAVAEDVYACTDTVFFNVNGGPVNVVVPDTAAVCIGDQIDLSVLNLDPNDTLTYLWSPANLFVPGTETTATPDYIEAIGQQVVTVSISNQFGCDFTQEVVVAVVDTAINLAFTAVVDCNGSTVAFTNTSNNAFGYVWDFGDGNGSFEENPVHTYVNPGNYTATLSIVFDVDCAVPATQTIMVDEPELVAAFDFDIAACTPGQATIQFTDASINTFNNALTWLWTFSNGQTSTLQNPSITVSQSGNLMVTLTITSANDCVASVTQTIDVQVGADLNLQDTVTVCRGDTQVLNPGANSDYQYTWSPSTGLSDPNAPSPTVTADVTTVYTLTVLVIGTDTCEITHELTVFVPADINLDLGPDVTTCGEDAIIIANAAVPLAQVQWFSANEGPLPSGMSISVNPFRTDTITAIATDAFGCVATDTIVIIDNGVDITTTPSGGADACEGVAGTISINNLDEQDQLTYNWSPAGNIIGSTTGASITYVVEEPGTVTFTAIVGNQFGCADTVSVTVTVTPFMPELPGDTVFICPNMPMGINPGGNTAYTYTWSPAEGLSDATMANPIFTGSQSTQYVVTVNDPVTDCTTMDSVQVVVYPELSLTVSPDTAVCELTPLVLTATTAVPGAVIEWFAQGSSTPDYAGTTVAVTLQEGTNTFTVVATDPATGCAETTTVTVTANAFEPNLPGDTVFICPNMPMGINPGGNTSYTYTWSPAAGLSDATIANPVFTGSQNTLYFFTVSDPVTGCMAMDSVQVVVYPELSLTVSPDTSVCELTPLVLTATTAVPGAVIEWFAQGSSTPDYTGTTVTVTLQEGTNTFTVVATDPATGCTDTAMVTVTANAFEPNLPDGDITACPNTPTPINPNGNTSYNYVWSPAGGLNSTVITNPIFTGTSDATYFVTVTDPATGCSVMDSVSVVLFPDLNLSTTGDTILCEIVPVTLTATTDVAATIEWYEAGSTTPDYTGNVVTVTPVNGTNTYTVIAIDIETGCRDTSVVVVTVSEITIGIPDEMQTVCSNTPTPLNPNGNPNFVYVWSPTDNLDLTDPSNPIITTSTPATYNVTITDPVNGCSLERTVMVDVHPPLVLTAAPDTTLCQNAAIILSATSQVANTTFNWYSDAALTMLVGTGAQVTITPPAGNNTYFVRAADANGCSETASVQVNVVPLQVSLTPATVVCEPINVFELTVTNQNPGQMLTYVWSPANAIIGEGATVFGNLAVTNQFSVVVTNEAGCSQELSTSVTVIDLNGTLSITAVPDTILLGESSVITVNGCPTCAYDWTVPSGTIFPTTGAIVTATPTDAGLNEYEVLVSLLGCTAELSTTVFVINAICDEDHLFLPNAFTPNGDGDNDILRLRTAFIDEIEVMELLIYNRWGEQIFRTTDPRGGWDGTFKGKTLSPDVYGFYLRLICPDGEEFIKKGNITLLR